MPGPQLQELLKKMMKTEGQLMLVQLVDKKIAPGHFVEDDIYVFDSGDDPGKIDGYLSEQGEFQEGNMQRVRDLIEDLVLKEFKQVALSG